MAYINGRFTGRCVARTNWNVKCLPTLPCTSQGNIATCISGMHRNQTGVATLLEHKRRCRTPTQLHIMGKHQSRTDDGYTRLHHKKGPSLDTAIAFTITPDTPWDILRAQILWPIWCQRVDFAFKVEHFHLGVVLWHAWRNTIYCAMEAYKELFRHTRNEEKQQQLIACFSKDWTTSEIFGRLRGGEIKWNLTPHKEFLPLELGAWTS